MSQLSDTLARLVLAERERDRAWEERDAMVNANLTLSVFLLHFRKQLIEHRRTASIDVYTPGEVLDVVIRSLDSAIASTKGKDCE